MTTLQLYISTIFLALLAAPGIAALSFFIF
jgi:hypothetical protein